MAGMKFVKYEGAAPKNAHRDVIIKNSQTLTVGYVVKYDSGFSALVGATYRSLGLVEGFVTLKGTPLEAALSSEYDGTYTTGSTGVGTYIATSDNQTDKKVMARVRLFQPGMVLSSPLDATINTTTGSGLSGYYMDVPASSDQLDESTSLTTVGQFMGLGQDPVLGGNNVYCTPVEFVGIA